MEKLYAHVQVLEFQHISIWYPRHVLPGEEWERERDNQLHSAHLILFLVSSAFLKSREQQKKMVLPAMERQRRGDAHVVPIILRPVHWQDTPFGKLQPLPEGGRPVTDPAWKSLDHAFVDVVYGIKRVIAQELPQPLARTELASKLSQPTHIRVTSSPSREGNKAVILFVLNGTEHALEYIRYDKIRQQILFLKEKQQELVRLPVPFGTLKTIEKQAAFQIDGVNGLLTFKMSAITGIMNIGVTVGGVEVFHN